eukprot:5772372-Lingulodinium_polyedra.AAC.1
MCPALRAVVVVADQARQGPGSLQLSREDCKVEGGNEDPIAIGACGLHFWMERAWEWANVL